MSAAEPEAVRRRARGLRQPGRATGRLRQQTGATILEVIIAAGILCTVAMGALFFFNNAYRTKKKDRLRQTQETIAATLKDAIKSPAHILYSVSRHDVNPKLAHCTLAISGDGCKGALNPKQPVRFGLFQVTNESGTAGKQLSTGERSSTIYYDIDGKICTNAGSGTCVLAAHTFFHAACDEKSDPGCQRGIEQAFFSYQVTQIPGSLALLGKELPPIPKVPIPVSLTAGQILGPHRYSKCGGDAEKLKAYRQDPAQFESAYLRGNFASIIGYDKLGVPICKCIYPFVKDGESEDPVTGRSVDTCRLLRKDELACTKASEGGFLRGVKSTDHDKELICVSEDEAFDCDVMEPTESCPESSWVTEVVRDGCLFTCEYVPDQVRKCRFSWHDPDPARPESDDDKVFPEFSCTTRELYCCQPSKFI